MVAGGNVTSNCEKCGSPFLSWASANRRFCGKECGKSGLGPTRHGASRTRLYVIWSDMKSRCSNPNNAGYSYYGGRGIVVCEEWRRSFEAFRDWANASGYTQDLELDRKNPDGNYEPTNCRWGTRAQQMQNTRKRRDAKTSKFKGVSKHSQNTRWVAQIGHQGRTIGLGCFATEEDAARRYDEEAKILFGEFAVLNFPSPSTEVSQCSSFQESQAKMSLSVAT